MKTKLHIVLNRGQKISLVFKPTCAIHVVSRVVLKTKTKKAYNLKFTEKSYLKTPCAVMIVFKPKFNVWGSPKTKFLFRFAIYFKFVMCTAIHPICGEIIY